MSRTWVTVLFPRQKENFDELDLIIGDDIKLLTPVGEDGWCKGELKGEVGFFPVNFTDYYNEEPVKKRDARPSVAAAVSERVFSSVSSSSQQQTQQQQPMMDSRPKRLRVENIKNMIFGEKVAILESLGIDPENADEDLTRILLLSQKDEFNTEKIASEIRAGCDQHRKGLEKVKALHREAYELFTEVEVVVLGGNPENGLINIAEEELRVMIIGENSSGKSLVLNLICCEDLLPSYAMPATPALCELRYGAIKKAKIIHKGNKIDEISLENCSPPERLDEYFRKLDRENPTLEKIEIEFPSPFLQNGIVLIDTPGMGENPAMDDKVVSFLPNCHGIIFVVDSSHGCLRQSVSQKLIVLQNKTERASTMLRDSYLFIFNKWDCVQPNERTKVLETMQKAIKQSSGLMVGNDSEFITMDSKTSFEYYCRIGALNEDHKRLHHSIIRYLVGSLEAKIYTATDKILELNKQVSDKLNMKQSTNRLTKDEKKQKMEVTKSQMIKLKEFTDFNAILSRGKEAFEKACYEILNLKLKLIATVMGLEKKVVIPQGSGYEQVNLVVQSYVDGAINDLILEWEQTTNRMKDAKQDLIKALKERSGEFFSQLDTVRAGLGKPQTPNYFRREYKIIAGILFPITVPLAALAVPVYYAVQSTIKGLKMLDFHKNYESGSIQWLKTHAQKIVERDFVYPVIEAKVKELLFYPDFYVENLKLAINQVIRDQEILVDNLANDQRDFDVIIEALAPLLEKSRRLEEKIRSEFPKKMN